MQRESELPHVPVSIGQTKFTALVDSGSAATLISSYAWSQLSDKPAIRPGTTIQLRSVTGNVLENQGEVDLPVTIGQHTTTVRAQIISGIPFQCILGINYIKSANLILRTAENCVQVGQERVPITSRCGNYNGPRAVSSVQAVTLAPRQGAVLTVKPDLLRPGKQLLEFTPLSEGATINPLLDMEATVGETSDSGLFQIEVANPSDQSIDLPEGTVLGTTTHYEGTVATVSFPGDPDLTNDVTDQENERAAQKHGDRWQGRWSSREHFLNLFDLSHLDQPLRNELESLLCEYESIFASHDFDLGQIQIATHTIKILPNAAPVYCRPFRCSEFERQELHRQLELMLKHGLIEPAYDGYRSPVLLVKKPGATSKTDQYRMVQSFVKLNAITEPIKYPLPNMHQILEDLGRHRGWFSSMDMTKSFWQIRIRPECAKYASFTTELGDYRPVCLLMGLRGASETLQRVVDQIYGPVLATGKVQCYLDDLVCATTDETDHMQTLRAVFSLAKKHDVKYKPEKTKLFHHSIKLLGHVISSEGIQVDNKKIAAITDIAPPTTKTEVRAFLGITAFYRRFVPNYANIALPLIHLLRKNVPFLFDDKCEEAFRALKTILTSAPVLRYPDFSGKYPFEVYTDASDKAIGAVLQQIFPDGSHPIAYASRVLGPRELCQPIYARESMAVVYAITETFRKYLQGRTFTLYCDNTAVSHLLKSVRDPKNSSARLTRDAVKLLDFDFTIQHVPGHKIPHADGLTRVSWKAMQQEAGMAADIDLDAPKEPVCVVVEAGLLPYSPEEWRRKQLSDGKLKLIIEHLEQDHVSKGPIRHPNYFLSKEGVLMHAKKDTKNEVTRVVPDEWCPLILKGYHDGPGGGHRSTRAMLPVIQQKYYWPTILSDVHKYVLQCPRCEQRNAGFLGKAPIQENYQATRPFQKMSIDFMTGLPTTDRGNTVLLTAICCFTRWVELIPLPDRSAKGVAEALTRRIFFRHGCCQIVSDSGKEFIGEIMSQVYRLLGIDARTNTFYHPASQGKVERSHRVIADILAKFVSSGQTDWDLFVPQCMMAINSSVHSATGYSPYYLVHGRQPTLPPDALLLNSPPPSWPTYSRFVEELLRHTQLAFAEANQQIGKTSAQNRDRINAKARQRQIEVGDRVLLYTPKVGPGEKRKLAMFWKPGYLVIQKFGNVNYLIEGVDSKLKQLVHVDRIKKQQSSSPPSADDPGSLDVTDTGPESPTNETTPQHVHDGRDISQTELQRWEWDWEDEVRAQGRGRADRARSRTPSAGSTTPSAPASTVGQPQSDQESISLPSTDGLHLSTEVTPGHSSAEETGVKPLPPPVPAPEPSGARQNPRRRRRKSPIPAPEPSETRRYPHRRRNPPKKWSPG